MKTLTFLITILLLFSTALAEPLKIVSTNFPPYVYLEKGKPKGFNVDLLNEIFSQMNMEISIEIVPWARALYMLENGYADAMFPLFKTAEREVFTDYSDPFTTEDTALFVLKDSPIPWSTDLKTFKKYKFGRVVGYSSGNLIDSLIASKDISLDEAVSTQLNIKKLLYGRIDIMIEAKYVALAELKANNQLKDIKILGIVAENTSYLGFSKKNNKLETITLFNTTLHSMKKNGNYQRIIDNYFQKDEK